MNALNYKKRLLSIAIGASLIIGASACATTSGSGIVVLECAVAGNGSISDCRVVSETPMGEGFSELALEAAERSTLPPDAVSVGNGRVRYTIRLQLEN